MDYQVIMNEANQAAADAAAEWMLAAEARGPKYSVHSHPIGGERGPAIDYMLDVCGFGWLEFPDKRSAFYRWCKKMVNADRVKRGMHTERTLYRVPVEGPYTEWRGRQEMGLKEAAMRAAASVYRKYDITVWVRTRID